MLFRSAMLLFGAFLTMSSSLTSQVTTFPTQPSKTPEARAAGIATYEISRSGDTADVVAFTEDEALLADCTVEWLKVSRVMTCTMGIGGRYRSTWQESRQQMKFEDLDHGGHFVLRFVGRGGEPPDPEKHPTEDGWTFQGTKTWNEVERDWGHITPIFGNLMGEVEMTLGLVLGDESTHLP